MGQRTNQSGFGTIEIVLVLAVVAVLAVTGLVVYQHHTSTSAKITAAANSPSTTTQPKSTPTTQPAQTATQYLTITEWGVKLPLSSTIQDAYYTVKGSNTCADGLPNTTWLGLTSLNSSGCNIDNTGPSSTASPIGSIIRVAPTDRDPVSGSLYTQQDPNGVTIGNYYYAYAPWKNKTCASATTLQSIDSAFGTAAKNAVKATAN